MSRKSERLVNLTIALLATKRYLTKAEIFANVAGYTGDSEAKDRMFERDKDDLRSLGIAIELGTFDPLFEDEAGYRIKPESYALQLQDLDRVEIALLAQAALHWREAALGDAAQSGLRKLKSLGIDSDLDTVIDISATLQSTPEQLPELIDAVSSRTAIHFEYVNEELVSQVRHLEPYRVSNARGYWYVTGRDLDRAAMRTFRVDRISSSITLQGRAAAFEIDQSALDAELLAMGDGISRAVIKVRKGRGEQLRRGSTVTDIDGEWDRVEVSYRSRENFLQSLLWYGTDAILVEPEDLREEVIARLERAVELHG